LALPSDARNMKVKTRLPVPSIATSGRWSKRADGEWGFDFDDSPSSGSLAGGKGVDNDDEANAAALSAAAASGKLTAGSDTETEDEDGDDNGNNKTLHPDSVNMTTVQKTAAEAASSTGASSRSRTTSANQSSSSAATSNATTAAATNSDNVNTSSSQQQQQRVSSTAQPISLVLRMRDEKKELQDIKFEFLPNKDTVDEISHELVNAKLIDAIDMIAVSANLNKLLENQSLSSITFPLVSLSLIFWKCLKKTFSNIFVN
jgi:hypothetical protein